MQIGNSTEEEEVIANDMGSPVIQFTGIHVSATYSHTLVLHYTYNQVSGRRYHFINVCIVTIMLLQMLGLKTYF